MTAPQNEESQDPTYERIAAEVLETHETSHPDRREHAKADPRADDDELQRRTQLERDEVATDRDA